jgi:hypothetical protein
MSNDHCPGCNLPLGEDPDRWCMDCPLHQARKFGDAFLADCNAKRKEEFECIRRGAAHSLYEVLGSRPAYETVLATSAPEPTRVTMAEEKETAWLKLKTMTAGVDDPTTARLLDDYQRQLAQDHDIIVSPSNAEALDDPTYWSKVLGDVMQRGVAHTIPYDMLIALVSLAIHATTHRMECNVCFSAPSAAHPAQRAEAHAALTKELNR